VHADAGDLAGRPLEPDPGQAVDPRRVDPAGAQGANQRFLEIATVLLDVLAVPG